MNDVIIKKLHKAYINNNDKLFSLIQKKYAPSSLIKFCSGIYNEKGDNYYLDSLKNKELWLSSPKGFNDPFDALYNIDCTELARKSFDDLVFKKFKHKKPKYINNVEKEKLITYWATRYSHTFEHIKNNSYMTCFSEKSNLISDSMWGYYANCHKGFCLEYDFALLSRYLIMPILYTNKYKVLNVAKKNVREFSLGITFNKTTEWQHEKEWRISASSMIDTRHLPGVYIQLDDPIAIYLGCLASQKLRNDIIDLCKKRKINLYEMYIIPNTFKMNYRVINL